MNVLVTGGAGFIGSNLAEELIRQGAKVRIIDNFLTGYQENLDDIKGDFDFYKADINNSDELKKALKDVEVVFHQAALPSVPRSVAKPAETHEVCVNGTFNVLANAKEAGVRRVIYAASSSAYGDQEISPKVETMRPEPLSPYAVAKLVGEYYAQVFYRAYGLETICLRYFNVFGPRQDPTSQYSGVISRFVDSLSKGERPTIYGDGEQTRDFTFVANVVNANIKASQTSKGIGEVINTANGEAISLNELLNVLKGLLERPDIEAIYEAPRNGDIIHSLADNTKAKESFGYEKLIGLEDGLSKTIDWWKKSRFAKI
ncbi:MAG: SDR family oxidoreductase [Pyrinomonadaceae bacterium]|jgi:UDP-glucose 4-epimerase|nr:SDR family oxidoreductase [Pyrinomonadaceae bacterium]